MVPRLVQSPEKLLITRFRHITTLPTNLHSRKIAQKHSPNKWNNKMNNSRRRRGDPELVTQVNCNLERRPHQTTIAICQKYILCSTIVDIARSAAISFCKLTQTDGRETENIRLSICFGFHWSISNANFRWRFVVVSAIKKIDDSKTFFEKLSEQTKKLAGDHISQVE